MSTMFDELDDFLEWVSGNVYADSDRPGLEVKGAIRHVRTPEGERRYDVEQGKPILVTRAGRIASHPIKNTRPRSALSVAMQRAMQLVNDSEEEGED